MAEQALKELELFGIDPKNPFLDEKILQKLKDEDFDDPPGYIETEEENAWIMERVRNIVQSKKPTIEDYERAILLIDKLPMAPISKISKLNEELQNILTKLGIGYRRITIPSNQTKAKGYAFVLLDSPDTCDRAKELLRNYRFSPTYVLQCLNMADIQKILERETKNIMTDSNRKFEDLPGIDTWFEEYEENNVFAVSDVTGNVSIFLMNPFVNKYSINDFYQRKIQWSTWGTYLAGQNEKEVVLTTATYNRTVRKFYHPGCSQFDFSPCEKYLITYSPTSTGNSQKMNVNIWDVNYNSSPVKNLVGDVKPFSNFKWSFDDSYLSFISDDSLIIYDLLASSLVNMAPLKIPHIQNVFWSTTSNNLVYWEKSDTSSPSNIIMLSVPSLEKRTLRQIFNLDKCSVYFNDNGNLLAVSNVRIIKKVPHHTLEIIHLNQKELTVDTVSFNKPVTDFAWEPRGDCCIALSKGLVKMFRVTSTSIVELKSFQSNTIFNSINWSPIGRIVVIAELTDTHVFEVWDVHESLQLAFGRHTDANCISWDPTGRYFVSYEGQANSSDGKLKFWSCSGYSLAVRNFQGLFIFSWRPRPALFSLAEINEMKAKLPDRIKEFSGDAKELQSTKNLDMDNDSSYLRLLLPIDKSCSSKLRKISEDYCRKNPNHAFTRVPEIVKSYTVPLSQFSS